jgi:hypothetical protein
MIKRLVILNSEIYGKAEILLDNCDTLQLVGPNNIGKSALIYALNFLFIIDGKKMAFTGNRIGDKKTIHHYFPSPNNSYILFEIFKQRYYCILIKRNVEGITEYYRFDNEYKEDLFFKPENGKPRLLKFEELKENLVTSGINLKYFSNKKDVFNSIYKRGKNNDSVVWLEDSVISDGISNNFSKIYRYLINPELITNRTLKDSLIIADSREKESINFSQKSRKEINELLKINNELKAIKSIQKSFGGFKELVNLYKAKSKIVCELVFAFNKNYSLKITELESSILKTTIEFNKLTDLVKNELRPHEQTLNQNLGKLIANKELNEIKQGELKEKIDHINSLESKQFLEESLTNLEKDRKQVETKITQIENQELTSAQIENKVKSLSDDLSRIESQINDYSNQIIHQITTQKKDKELLNYILSEDFSSLSKKYIKEKISKTRSLMKLFDGSIKLPDNLKGKKIDSIEELKQKQTSIAKELNNFEKLLLIAKDFEKANRELADIKLKITTVQNKISLLDSKPELEKSFQSVSKLLEDLLDQKGTLEKEIEGISNEITEKTESIKKLNEDKLKQESNFEHLKTKKKEIESLDLEPIPYQTSDDLNTIFSNFKKNNSDRESLKYDKNLQFEKLKNIIQKTYANEDEFINYVDEELACLDDKEKSITVLLQNISTQFANPAYSILKRFDEFKAFVNNRFNRKLGEIIISDIDSLKIDIIENRRVLKELKQISAIRDLSGELALEFDQSENLAILNKYLDNEKSLKFEDLFDIQLHLNKKGENKKVDLKDQIESDGTNKMIRLIIIMAIINRLAISDKENKVVIFVDEIGTIDEDNRIELLKFCKDHNFIPISAAPLQPYDGFDKYYFLYRSKGKININETKNVIRRFELSSDERN